MTYLILFNFQGLMFWLILSTILVVMLAKLPLKHLTMQLWWLTKTLVICLSPSYPVIVQYCSAFFVSAALSCFCGLIPKGKRIVLLPSLMDSKFYGRGSISKYRKAKGARIVFENNKLRMKIVAVRQLVSRGTWGLMKVLVGYERYW